MEKTGLRAGGGVAVMGGRGRELDRSGGERALTVGAPAPDHPTRAVPLGTTLPIELGAPGERKRGRLIGPFERLFKGI